jgi:hypothetical protein
LNEKLRRFEIIGLASLMLGPTPFHAQANPPEKVLISETEQKDKSAPPMGRQRFDKNAPMKKLKGPPNPMERGSCEFLICIDNTKRKGSP